MRLELSVDVAAPPARTFTVFTDVPGAAGRLSGVKRIEMLTPLPVGAGTRWKETRVMFGREATETMWFSAFDPPRSAVVESNSCGMQMASTFSFEPIATGTRVRFTLNTRPLTFMARLMTPLGWLFSRTMRKLLKKDLDELARAAEKS